MLPSKTVFIVGAGASSEVGLPVGAQLKGIISKKLDLRFESHNTFIGGGDIAIYDALSSQYGPQINRYLDACWRIRDGLILSSSIDDFIDTHRHDAQLAQCGKLAIACSILEAERVSKLFFERKGINSTINFVNIQDTWYVRFYQLIAQQVARSELDELFKNISVITFNYDRCLEQFLVHAVASNFQIPIAVSSKIVEGLAIHRPYGSVGRYFGENSLEYGSTKLPHLEQLFGSLRTYTERIEDPSGLNAIRTAIANAEVLVFLGNAFHPNNMRVLGSGDPHSNVKRIYATRKGISDADLPIVMKQFSELCGVGEKRRENFLFSFEGEKCVDLFERFRMSLRQ